MDTDVRSFEDLTRSLSGLAEYTVVDADDAGVAGLNVTVRRTRAEAACPACGEFSFRVKSCRTSTVRDAAWAARPTVLLVAKRAFRCDATGCARKSFTETTAEVPARARTTTRCREAIGVAGRDRSTASVAREYLVSWGTAWAAIQGVARRALANSPRKAVTRIGIDETRFWWKQPWLTGIVDLDTSGLVGIVCGRSGSSVIEWVNSLSDLERANILVVVTDPHAGYRRAVADHLPTSVQVVDRFHVAMLANKAITDVRRRRMWELQDRRGRRVDPSWRARRDLCRRSANLTANGWKRIIEAMRTDNATSTGELDGDLLWTWAAKEYLADLYDTCVDRAHAQRQLMWWYSFIADHHVPELVRLATTISQWENEFLNYFDTRATNGRVEGRNRIIKHVKRLGFGFTNTDNYTLRIRYRCLPVTSPIKPAKQAPAASIA